MIPRVAPLNLAGAGPPPRPPKGPQESPKKTPRGPQKVPKRVPRGPQEGPKKAESEKDKKKTTYPLIALPAKLNKGKMFSVYRLLLLGTS